MSTQDTGRTESADGGFSDTMPQVDPEHGSLETTPQVESDSRSTVEELFQLIEKNRGRVRVLTYACFGLANDIGKEARCLTWVLSDIDEDLGRMEEAFKELGPEMLCA